MTFPGCTRPASAFPWGRCLPGRQRGGPGAQLPCSHNLCGFRSPQPHHPGGRACPDLHTAHRASPQNTPPRATHRSHCTQPSHRRNPPQWLKGLKCSCPLTDTSLPPATVAPAQGARPSLHAELAPSSARRSEALYEASGLALRPLRLAAGQCDTKALTGPPLGL